MSNLLGIRELLSCQHHRHTPDCSVNIHLFLQAPIIPKSKSSKEQEDPGGGFAVHTFYKVMKTGWDRQFLPGRSQESGVWVTHKSPSWN